MIPCKVDSSENQILVLVVVVVVFFFVVVVVVVVEKKYTKIYGIRYLYPICSMYGIVIYPRLQ